MDRSSCFLSFHPHQQDGFGYFSALLGRIGSSIPRSCSREDMHYQGLTSLT